MGVSGLSIYCFIGILYLLAIICLSSHLFIFVGIFSLLLIISRKRMMLHCHQGKHQIFQSHKVGWWFAIWSQVISASQSPMHFPHSIWSISHFKLVGSLLAKAISIVSLLLRAAPDSDLHNCQPIPSLLKFQFFCLPNQCSIDLFAYFSPIISFRTHYAALYFPLSFSHTHSWKCFRFLLL